MDPPKPTPSYLGDLKLSDVKKRIGRLFELKVRDVTNWIENVPAISHPDVDRVLGRHSSVGGMRVNDVIKGIGDTKVSDVMKRIEMLPKYDVTISIDELESKQQPAASSEDNKYRLRRVPEWVRAVDSDAYTPQYICIGPYHRGEPGNHLRREELKIDSVQRLLQAKVPGIREKADIRGCFNVLKQQVSNTRRLYAQEFDMDDDDWAMMLLLDGCFIIMHLLDYAYFARSDHIRPVAAQIKIDLVLLENQLPFSVLEKIFDFLFEEGSFFYSNSRMLRGLALFYWTGREGDFDDMVKVFDPEKVIHHLVHLIHLAHCDMIDAAQDLQRLRDSKSGAWGWAVWSKKFKKAIGFCPIMLMMVLCCCFRDEHILELGAKRGETKAAAAAAADKTEDDDMSLQATEFQENIASAKELHNLGIRFVTTKDVGGSEYHVRISGNDEDALVIPPVDVSWKTAPLLHNLIALEQQAADELKIPDHFSKYAFLMYNLVNSPEDIALLQGRGILLNNYGTDKQVVSYFKNLLLWNSRDSWKSPAGQTPIEKVCHFFANLCPWKVSRSAEQDARMAVEKALDVLQDRTKHRAYRDWAEARKYWNSPVQVVLLIIATLTLASTVVSLRSG